MASCFQPTVVVADTLPSIKVQVVLACRVHSSNLVYGQDVVLNIWRLRLEKFSESSLVVSLRRVILLRISFDSSFL